MEKPLQSTLTKEAEAQLRVCGIIQKNLLMHDIEWTAYADAL
jgi:hypothetical protein